MRVMTYNVLKGGQERMAKIAHVIRAQRPDLLVLQECLGWEDGDSHVQAVAAAMEVEADEAHARVGRSSPRASGRCYNVSVLSRAPMVGFTVHADPSALAHCIVEARVGWDGGTLTLYGTHFNAHDESHRVAEACYLGTLSGGSLPEWCLLAGDLNALTPDDPYPQDLGERFLTHGVRKYGHPPRFDVMRKLQVQGWRDTLHARTRAREWITAWRPHGHPTLGLRTDYILASPPMLERLERAWVVPDYDASDHAPVLADFHGCLGNIV